jgi:Domain of unknown function (DUF4287)/Domain of unknown function (DUF5655)
MTFQAYLDTVKAKTGLAPDDFRQLAADRGLLAEGTPTAAIIAWLKEDFGLGQGHGMAIVATFRDRPAATDRIAAHFGGTRAHWREPFDSLVEAVRADGPVELSPTDSYISLLVAGRKFAVVAVTAARMDVGIKLKDAPVTDRFEASGRWNAMVTHRVRITDPVQIDTEVVDWVRRAYSST